MSSWDLWLDYHRRDADGLTHGNVRNARPGAQLEPGRYVVVGNEEADAAVAEIVRFEDNGVVLVRVVPGSVEDNRALLETVIRHCQRCPKSVRRSSFVLPAAAIGPSHEATEMPFEFVDRTARGVLWARRS